MARTVITIARQIGSDGDKIAADLAQALGVQLIERQIIEAAAKAADVSPEMMEQSEKAPSLLERMLEYLGAHGTGVDPIVEFPTQTIMTAGGFNPALTTDAYRALVEQVIRKTAEETDAVIVAHGSSIVLREVPYVFRVLVCAPLRVRVQRLQEMLGYSAEEAEQDIREDDKTRAEYFQTYHKVNWINPAIYDLSINTGRLSIETAVELIVKAHREASL